MYCELTTNNVKNNASSTLTATIKMRESPLLEAVGHAFAADGLLSDTRNHLRDVDRRALRATHSHDQGTIGRGQLFQACVTSIVTNC